MYAAQEGYVHDEGYAHRAQVLVDKYWADPLLSLPADHHGSKKHRRQQHLGVAAMDDSLKSSFAVVRLNLEEGYAIQKTKTERIEQLIVTVEYLRTFKLAYMINQDEADDDEEEAAPASKRVCS
jgi:hypothetical protein